MTQYAHPTPENDLDAKVTAAIEAAIDAAVASGDIASADDAFVVLQPSGHITVLPKSEAPTLDASDDEEAELPPFELPAMYREDNERESLVDTPYYDQHLSSNWGF